MKFKLKLFLSLAMALSVVTSLQLKANDEELVCFYQENENGELELVCVDSSEAIPCQWVCLPPCIDPEK